ncbi:MAG: site-2 protease family protein [Chloroflexi bacterium]|nr:site-2 protease family protein [Chloroflexota bacterium]
MDILLFVFILGLLILLHELGHFLAAKALGIEIEEFGIGFPPRIATLFEWKGTRFTLNAIPLGGFVRPKGEGDPEHPDALAQAPAWKRFFVVLAGPAMNFLVAWLAYLILFVGAGLPEPQGVLIWYVEPNSPAAEAGLQVGDVVIEAEGQPTRTPEDLQRVVQAHLGEPLTLTVLRNGQRLQVTAVPRPDPPPNQGPLGIRIVVYGWRDAPLSERVRTAWETFVGHTRALIQLPWQWVKHIMGVQTERPAGELIGFRGMYSSFSLAFQIDRVSPTPVPVYSLSLLASLSLSLAVLNLLPFPALDGSRLLLALAEMIFKRRLPRRVEVAIMFAGFVLLLSLMVIINLREWL